MSLRFHVIYVFYVSLYAAFTHQLDRMGKKVRQLRNYKLKFTLGLFLFILQLSVQELRQMAATHMRAFPDNFLPFLSNPDTGDPLTDRESLLSYRYLLSVSINFYFSKVSLKNTATNLNQLQNGADI